MKTITGNMKTKGILKKDMPVLRSSPFENVYEHLKRLDTAKNNLLALLAEGIEREKASKTIGQFRKENEEYFLKIEIIRERIIEIEKNLDMIGMPYA